MSSKRVVVNVEGPESIGADFVLGPYGENEGESVRRRLHERLTAQDPDFRVWVTDAPGGTTEADVYEFFGIDDADTGD